MGSDFAAWLGGIISSVLSWVVSIITGIFSSVWTMLQDFLIYVLDQLLTLVTYVVSSLTFSFGGFSPVAYWNALPSELLSTLNLLGVPVALGMIVAALTIRFILQIIPFVRWGS